MALVVTGLADAAQLRADDEKMMLTPAKLEGTYRIVKGEEYGGNPPKENVKDTTCKFSKDRITSYDAGNNEVYVQTYKLDASSKPTKLMMTSVKPKADLEVKGLIKMEGDMLTLIYALPGGEAPTEFKTGAKQLMFTMKKIIDKK